MIVLRVNDPFAPPSVSEIPGPAARALSFGREPVFEITMYEAETSADSLMTVLTVSEPPEPPSFNEIPGPAASARSFGRDPVVPTVTYDAETSAWLTSSRRVTPAVLYSSKNFRLMLLRSTRTNDELNSTVFDVIVTLPVPTVSEPLTRTSPPKIVFLAKLPVVPIVPLTKTNASCPADVAAD